jgi:hypothetical protein
VGDKPNEKWILRAADLEDECGGVMACGGAFRDGIDELANAECPDAREVIESLNRLIGYSVSHSNIGLDAILRAKTIIYIWDARLQQQAAEIERLKPREIAFDSNEGFAVRMLRKAASRGDKVFVESKDGDHAAWLNSEAVTSLLIDKMLRDGGEGGGE